MHQRKWKTQNIQELKMINDDLMQLKKFQQSLELDADLLLNH